MLGISRFGAAVSTRFGISVIDQFLFLVSDRHHLGTPFSDFYLYQFYLPDRRQSRGRHFPLSYCLDAHRFLLEHLECPDWRLLAFKELFAGQCHRTGLPTVPIVAEFNDGDPSAAVGALPAADLFSKPAGEHSGKGVKSWRYDHSQDCYFLADRKFKTQDVIDNLYEQSRSGKVILQERVGNHSAMAPITNGALATIRITTCRAPSGSLDLLPPVVRMPAGMAVADNFDTGGIAAPVDLATGTISGPGVQKDIAVGIKVVEAHPDTGMRLRGFTLPLWAETVALAIRAHETFPSLPSVGWDIAVLPSGPVVLEGNPIWSSDVVALPHGITLSDTQFIPYYNFHLAAKSNAAAA